MRPAALCQFGARLLLACAVAAAAFQEPAQAGDASSAVERSGLGCLVAGPTPATLSDHRDQLPSPIDPLTVRVRMRFSKPDAEPATEIVFSNADDGLNASVIKHVQHYRLPCFAGERDVVGLQEFVFLDDGRPVLWHPVRAEMRDPDYFACKQSFKPGPPGANAYALRALNDYIQGNAVLRLTFLAPDSPPDTEVVFEGGPGLGQAAKAMAEKYRLPCMRPGARPVEAMQTFLFRLNGLASVSFKEVDLRQFLGMVANVKGQRVLFDFRTMACPFDVNFTLGQPSMRNDVDDSAWTEPNRREFVEWLTTVSTNFPKQTLAQLIGTGMKVSVPCTVLNLL